MLLIPMVRLALGLDGHVGISVPATLAPSLSLRIPLFTPLYSASTPRKFSPSALSYLSLPCIKL
jgi:hypothetical protein